jgi:hypothetical protein
MGDRGNVFVDTDNDGKGVYLYTHWGGSDLPDTVRKALMKKWRWSDPSYLARIIFCEMVKGQENRETGFGISCERHDHNWPTVKVLTDVQEVHIGELQWTFEEYIDDGFKNPFLARRES